MHAQILQPVALLILWSLVMWLWMYAVRIPAMQRARIDAAKMVGGTGKDLDAVLPAAIQWKAHNYNHLMEQPTLFYAVALLLAVVGAGNGLNATLAWIYLGFRVAHSLVQATSNRVLIRFALHLLGTIPLIMLSVHAVVAVFA